MDYEKAFKEAYERASLRFGTNVANELFLEYKESKEERTRRNLIEFFSDWSKTKSHCWGIRVTDIMDWLEKQGKNNMGISEATKKELEDKLHKALEKETAESFNAFLDEQKPAETEKGTNGNEREIPNSTWSEEDEICLQNALIAVKDKYPNGSKTIIPWLNSLKERYTWKPADGDDLPDIDREVVVLIKYNAQRNVHDKEYSTYRVGFGHRPNPDGWDGKNILTGEVDHYTPKIYDKGGWNIPDVKWWLDLELPKIEE